MRDRASQTEGRTADPRPAPSPRPTRGATGRSARVSKPGEGKELLITMGLLVPGCALVLGGIVAIKGAHAVAAGLTAMAFGVLLLGTSLLRTYLRDYRLKGHGHPVVVFLFVTFVPAVCGVLLTRLLLGR
ncbi:MAG: hypothetical protein V1748_01330 [Actinomycetota bacterium]